MAELTVESRTKIWRGLMRFLSRNAASFPVTGLTKFDLYNPATNTGGIAETDAWIDTHGGNTCNTTGFNGGLTEPYKGNAGLALKTLVFCAVAAFRVSESFARLIFGEVD